MPKQTFTFRLDSEGADQLRKELEALGPAGKAAFDKLAAAAGPATKNLADLGKQAKLSFQDVEILRSGIINVAQSLAAGMDPVQVFTTQLAQTAPALGGVAKAAGISTAAMVGWGGAIAVATAGAIAFGTALSQGAAQSAQFNAAIKLTANAAGITAGQMDTLAGKVAATGKMTATTARSIATELVATGKLSADTIGKVTSLTADYAAATKTSAEDAGKALGQIFADPLKGAKQLDAAYNLLSGAELKRIQNLVEQGNQAAAQAELADKLNDRFKNLSTDGMGNLERGWTRLKNAAAGAWDAMLAVGRGESIEDEITRIQALVAKGANATPGTNAYNETQDLKRRLTTLQSQKSYQDEKAANDAAYQQLQDLAKGASDAAAKYQTFADKQQALTNEVIKWQKAVDQFNNLHVQFKGPEDAEAFKQASADAESALEGAQRQLANLKSPAQLAAQKLADQRAINAAPPAQRAAIAAGINARRSAENDPNNTAGDVDAIATAAQQQAIEQQATALRDRNAQIDLGIKLTNDAAAAWMKSEAAGKDADAQRQAVLASVADGLDVATEKSRILQQQASQAAEAGAQQVQKINQQVADQQKVLDAAGQGRAAEQQAVLANQIAAATKDLRDAEQSAINPAQAAAYRKEIDGIAAGMTTAAQQAKAIDLSHAIDDQNEQVQLLQAQLALLHQGSDAQSEGLAIARAMIDLQRQGIEVNSELGQEYLKNADALAKMSNELSRQQKIAQELPDFFDKAFDDITQGLTNLSLKSGNAFKDLKNVGAAFLSELTGELTKLSFINPFKNWILGTNQNPTLGGVAQFYAGTQSGNGGATQALYNLQGYPVGGSNGGSNGSLFGNLLNLVGQSMSQSQSSMMGGGGMGGMGGMMGGGSSNPFSSLSSMFNSGSQSSGGGLFSTNNGQGWLSQFGIGANATNASGFRITGAGPGASANATTASGFSGFMGSGVGSGIASGVLSFGSSMAAGQGAQKSIAPAVGSTVGGIIGSYWGPIGSQAGSMIGNLLGQVVNLFAFKDKTKKFRAYAYQTTNAYGGTSFDRIHTTHMDNADAEPFIQPVSQAFSGLNSDLGLSFDPGISVMLGSYTKQKGKKSKSFYVESWDGAKPVRFKTVDEALTALLSTAIFKGNANGDLNGANANMQELFKSAAKRSGGVISDKDKLTRLTDFAKFYGQLDRVTNSTEAASKGLRDLNQQMDEQKRAALEFGISIDKVTAIFRDNFNTDIQNQIQQLADPEGYALKQLELQHAAQVAQAQAIGADLVSLEKLYGLQREQILEQGLDSMNDSLRDFFNQLTLGDLSALSPQDQLAEATGRYNDVIASGSKADFVDAAQNYLTVQRAYNASNSDYAAAFADVLANTRRLGNIPGFAAGGFSQGGLHLVGERGPELRADGPARYYSNSQTMQMLRRASNSNSPVVDNQARQMVEAMRAEMSELRDHVAGMRGDIQNLTKATVTNTDHLRYSRSRK